MDQILNSNLTVPELELEFFLTPKLNYGPRSWNQ